MARTYTLNHFAKGTGAAVEPVDEPRPDEGRRPELNTVPVRRERRARSGAGGARTASPLPPGHVRKKTTGEIGRVRSVDAKAGTASVMWLRTGATSTVPLASLSRR